VGWAWAWAGFGWVAFVNVDRFCLSVDGRERVLQLGCEMGCVYLGHHKRERNYLYVW